MVILFLVLTKQYLDVFSKKKIAMMVFMCVGISGVLFQVVTRIGFVVSILPVLRGNISSEVYVQQQKTPLSRGPFDRWYGGYWKSYRYTPSSQE